MSVRAIDSNGDWIFGIGKSAYLTGRAEIAQDILTRIKSFLGDCFFDMGAGIDWFNFLSSKNQIGLNLAVSAVILNTESVLSINELSVVLDSERNFTLEYSVNTLFGVVTSQPNIQISGQDFVDDAGDTFTTDDGSTLITD